MAQKQRNALQSLLKAYDIWRGERGWAFLCLIWIEEIDENHVKAKLKGEPIKPELGETVVKAVTYHKYKLEKIKPGYKVTITLDI
jgi:SHS2 domain-containing protein